jgi:kinesin family protein 5
MKNNTDHISVFVRFKPPGTISLRDADSTEIREAVSSNHYKIHENQQSLNIVKSKLSNQNIYGNDITAGTHGISVFTVDRVFPYKSTQQEIFDYTIIPLLKSFINGSNAAIVCFGQTRSGKTYTMMGPLDKDSNFDCKATKQIGIIPRIFEYIFNEINQSPVTSKYTIELSYFELINDEIQDLLNLNNNSSFIKANEISSDNAINDYSKSVVYVDELRSVQVENMDDVYKTFKIGNKNKNKLKKNMNQKSSRSDSIIRLEITLSDLNTSNVHKSSLLLIDSAGFAKSTSIHSNTILTEIFAANSFLCKSGNVFSVFNEKSRSQDIQYKSSRSSGILQNAVEKIFKTVMIFNCSSDLDDLNETILSLEIAQNLKNIHNSNVKNQMFSVERQNKTIIKENNTTTNTTTTNNNNKEITETWKIKYHNALKKIVELETELEFNQFEDLKAENKALKESLKEALNQLRNNEYNSDNNLENNVLPLNEFESLQSNVNVYRKLLVSKTDQILELESQLENFKIDQNKNVKNITRKEPYNDESIVILKEMKDIIEYQNDDLLQQVEQAKQLLFEKDEQLKQARLKWEERNTIVINEQNEVNSKLSKISERLRNVTIYEHEKETNLNPLKLDMNCNKSNINNFNNSVRKGLNLHITKPK